MNNEISVKDLISSFKKKGLLQSIPQLEQIYQFAIEVEKKLAESETKCVQLAAENVALKQAESNLVRNIINDLGDTEFKYARVQTPTTDLFITSLSMESNK
ncbi:TPA: hypothetical protein RUY31_003618 [Klebsiella quasipneumoniae subsp. similipneumoniae]|nr:hypothetical protein [Klebsiella quasipneumoniae subsp. similipneumoniae]